MYKIAFLVKIKALNHNAISNMSKSTFRTICYGHTVGQTNLMQKRIAFEITTTPDLFRLIKTIYLK